MQLNDKKTKFFVINHDENDKLSMKVRNYEINYCPRYLYLGGWFSDTGKMKQVVDMHVVSGEAVVNKFAVFSAANTDMPYCYKKRVFDAAISASLLYGSETWLTNNYAGISRQYNKVVKCLLGVRGNTSVNLCLVESGIAPMQNVVACKRKTFLESKLHEPDLGQPFHFVYNLCQEANTPGYRFLRNSFQFDTTTDQLHGIKQLIMNKPVTATKYYTYKTELNPDLSLHEVYSSRDYVPDYVRQAFTRIRLMSHNLKIEKGRWSRIPREQRLCSCNTDSIQTESHVLLECSLSQDTRQRYPVLNFHSLSQLFGDTNNIEKLCTYIVEVLRIY